MAPLNQRTLLPSPPPPPGAPLSPLSELSHLTNTVILWLYCRRQFDGCTVCVMKCEIIDDLNLIQGHVT